MKKKKLKFKTWSQIRDAVKVIREKKKEGKKE